VTPERVLSEYNEDLIFFLRVIFKQAGLLKVKFGVGITAGRWQTGRAEALIL